MDFLKVSSKSSPASVAGALPGMVKDGVPVNMQCVGQVRSTRPSRRLPSRLPHSNGSRHLLRPHVL